MLTFIFRRYGDIGLLVVKNKELTLKSLDKLRDTLKWALQDVNHLILSFEKVKKVDQSFQKLICFAHHASFQLNKRVIVTGIQTGIFQSMEESGSSHLMVAP